MQKVASGSARRRARLALDSRLAQRDRLTSTLTVPKAGWIHAIRSALGMSTSDLGARLGVTPSTVTRMERSEHSQSIQLDTLARAANALDCDLVYALVPRASLEDAVRAQATRRARQELAAIDHSMALEKQSVPTAHAESALEREIDAWTNRLGLWNE